MMLGFSLVFDSLGTIPTIALKILIALTTDNLNNIAVQGLESLLHYTIPIEFEHVPGQRKGRKSGNFK